MSLVSLIIVNWNSGRQLSECLASIRRYGGASVREIFVIDNASSDGSNLLSEAYSGVRLIQADSNLGFAKACNLAARQATGAYYLFLNPDARLFSGSIDTALRFMEGGGAADVGICGIRLVDLEGNTHRHCARFPTWRTYVGHVLGLNRVLPLLFPPHFMTEFDHETSREVDQVIGAFFLVRQTVFEAMGGFDERFFVYMEELDFSLRARRAGWRSWYLADVSAYHKGGGTSERVKAYRLFYSLRSRILYAFKHFHTVAAWSVFALTICIEPVTRIVRCTLRRSYQDLSDTARGYWLLWSDIRNVVRAALK
jgi:GT2 family glycosyltransferase